MAGSPALTTEDREGLERETVVEEFEAGYKLGSLVLRPARVKVARPKRPEVLEKAPDTDSED